MSAVDHVAPAVLLDGPCGWSPDLGCGDCAAYQGLDPTIQQQLVDYAAGILWRRTGRRYGLCEVTVRPCRDDCPTVGGPGWPHRIPGSLDWTNTAGCGSCGGPCSCGGKLAQVTLPGPVHDLVDVTVDGTALDLQADPPDVRVDNYATLVRQDGQPWPACQHLGDPPPGSWSVTYRQGRPLPPAGRWALGRLVCELGKACAGQPCRIPNTATSVVRQGVTVQLPPVDVLTSDGLWGLPEVDQWIAAEQSAPVRARPPVSPDVTYPRRQTWPALTT